MMQNSGLVNSNWAEFSAVGFDSVNNQDTFSGSEMGGSNDGMMRKSSQSKKKKKKSDRSESSDGKKKKKKKSSKSRSKSSDDDNENEEFGNKLFEKAMAKAQSEEEAALTEAFRDMCEDQEFVNAFDGSNHGKVGNAPATEQANFDAFNTTGFTPPEQAPQMARVKRDDSEGDNGEFFVENDNKGADMSQYSRRRASVSLSVTNSMDNSSRSGSMAGSRMGASRSHYGSVAETHTTPVARGSTQMGSSRAATSRTGSTAGASTAGSIVDFSSYQLDIQNEANMESMNDSATINSELTGLTGVFSAMPSTFEEDDSESLTDEDGDLEGMNYPKYDPAMSKFMMMQNQPKKNKPKYRIKFGTVTVREFNRIMGDSPAVKTGAPISIGWKVQSVQTYATPDEHDAGRNRPQRPATRLVLNRDQRHAMLLELGYSQRDIAQAVRATIKTKNKRRTTVNNLVVSNVEEKMESVRSGMKRMLFLKKSDK